MSHSTRIYNEEWSLTPLSSCPTFDSVQQIKILSINQFYEFIYFFLEKIGIQFSYIASSFNPRILNPYHMSPYIVELHLLIRTLFFCPCILN